ncbi:terminase large subunit domain-containing protein [Hydrogenophaga electricum]|uniref:Bacteriophage terminase ATPase subunit n=1 Tax=Hydrogenophaga electricum TaxID=1230953 RepID=A0ABQ6C0S4_9BURK|nr:terminase family protein [Hydrogenophaga electricum]GLS13582.1 bacteriophage terminase ATPase subunit [Hydrogenophaga electricum]
MSPQDLPPEIPSTSAPVFGHPSVAPVGHVRHQARRLYWQGYTVAEICRELQVPEGTAYSWKSRERWDECPVSQRINEALDARLVQLLAKDNKSNADYKEIDQLMRQVERLAKIERYGVSGKPSHLNERQAGNHVDKRATPNAVHDEQIDAMVAAFLEEQYGYQNGWYAERHQRIRDILKSRQIGATYYFAHEAFIDALLTGDNQIFLSASRAQAEVFRGYIVDFARRFGVDLKGNPIVLANSKGGGPGATLYFLSTSARTAQSYHGHLYFDEIFWVQKFKELNKVASGMSMHKKWRKTYFSTPSSKKHEAYAFWSGAGRTPEIDVSHAALHKGVLCSDGQWRQIITVMDAMASGCDLFDIDQLRLEYTPEDFAQLLMCEFMDDEMSVFGFEELLACGVDSLVAWRDFNRTMPRPLGAKRVLVGYDPSRTRDNAAVVVIAVPEAKGAPYRLLEKHEWSGMDFVSQAAAIKRITERYNVVFMGIDTTGVGIGVYDIVRTFYPAARRINYNPETKARLVIRAKELVRSRRLLWDAGWNDVMRAFLSIRRVQTASGNAITFEADRSETTGHADLAWAVMHALDNQPLRQIDPNGGQGAAVMQFSD